MEDKTLMIAITTKAKLMYQDGMVHFCPLNNIAELNVTFKVRGTVAGWAHTSRNTVDYNLGIARENQLEFMNDTVGHEVSHIVARNINPYCKPHGDEWKMVMRYFGLTPERCHDMPCKRARRTKVYQYKCICGKVMVIRKKTAICILNGNRDGHGYYCKHCKHFLNDKTRLFWAWSNALEGNES